MHDDEGYRDIGRVVHVSDDKTYYWWIAFPQIKSPKNRAQDENTQAPTDKASKADLPGKHQGRLQPYIKRPRVAKIADAVVQIKQGLLSTCEFAVPHEWSLTDDELKRLEEKKSRLLAPSRRKYSRWIAHRDRSWSLIKPIIARATELQVTTGHLLETGEAFDIILQLCSDTAGVKETQPNAAGDAQAVGSQHPARQQAIEQAFFRYLLGGCEKNALLPGWRNCGAKGTKKFSSVKTGRPNREARLNTSDRSLRGHICTDLDRKNLARGWKRYLIGNTTEEQAYLATMEEYYAKSVTYLGPGKRDVVLLEPHLRPTQAEFRSHGIAKRPEAMPSAIHMGEIAYSQEKRPLRGKARDGMIAVGQVGWIDSTPEDQNLVSDASRHKLLPTSHRTMIVDGASEYILGVYAGFEPSSTMTGLLALLHAGQSKVAWCARYGVTIEESDWLAFTPRRLRGDNSDLKSDEGIHTLLASEVGLEVVRAWWASHKAPVESKHKVLHRNADHLSAGTSRGRQRKRGERPADEDACLTFTEKMPTLIRAILQHNNDDRVPHLLDMEMRGDGIEPTRKAIFEWRVKNNYVTTEPTNLQLLKAKCLPKFRARVDGGSIKLYDPREKNGTRLIPDLEYWSDWLHDAGATARAKKGVVDCEVQLDPTYPAEAWVNAEGMHRLEMRTDDPLKLNVTLWDWILITDDDNLKTFLARGVAQNKRATHLSSARAANEEAQAAKEVELQQASELPSKKKRKESKRTNRQEEIAAQKLQLAGLGSLAPAPESFGLPAASDDDYIDPDDDPYMNLVRARTQA